MKRELNKKELMQVIKNAKESICIIGATIFDLDWKELLGKEGDSSGLLYKFFHIPGFSIQILRESENLIAQYALLTQGASEEIFSRGNLNGIKNNIVSGLKDKLVKYAKDNNLNCLGIEPPEDVFKKELQILSNKIVRTNIIDNIVQLNLDQELIKAISNVIKSYFDSELNGMAEKITKEKGWNTAIRIVPEIQKEVETVCIDLNNRFKSALDFKNLEMEGFNFISSDGDIKLCFGTKLQQTLHNAIIDFKVEGKDSHMINANLVMTREKAEKLASFTIEEEIHKYSVSNKTKQRLFIKDCYMPIPVALLKVDNDFFITHALTKFNSINKFQYVGKTDSLPLENLEDDSYRSYWIKEFQNYYDRYFDPKGVQKYSTEETEKGDRKEVIDIFNENRVRIGTGPRDAFLSNMAIVKSVVWALIFDRNGNMLIHQRALNAKDNRGLWDKSVGGHVSVRDLDTIDAVRREVAEELYELENEGQGGHDKVEWLEVNMNKMIYLGDWETGRYPSFDALNLNRGQYYVFSLNYPFEDRAKSHKNFRTEVIFTERLLPGGKIVKAKCFADPYLCIVAEDFDISKLENSEYAMISPNELKSCMDRGTIRINRKTRYYDSNSEELPFQVTSDLKYLMDHPLWNDVVTEFSKRIKEEFGKNK